MEIPDHSAYLLRLLYAGQEARVRTGPGTTDWFQIGKGVHQGCTSSLCAFNLFAEFSSVQSLSCVWLFATPWTVAHQTPLSMGYPGKNTGVVCHFLLQGIFLTEGSNPSSICRVHHVKCRAEWITSYNQVCWEKYHQPNICRWYHSIAESEEELKSLLMKVKEQSEKPGLKLNVKKLRSWHLVPSLHGK